MKPVLLFLFFPMLIHSCQQQNGEYICKPCNFSCDNLSFDGPGTCPECNMELVLKSGLRPGNAINTTDTMSRYDTGKFVMEGGFKKEKTITVHYYKPKKFTPGSAVIMVIPGAGRNGADYRDAWVEKADRYNLIVISPEYSEENYPGFWSYNLAGMMTDVKMNADKTDIAGFTISLQPNEWIFNDFDRIFNRVKDKLKLTTDTYDMFGHSAGGQILHRFALFNTTNKANRILASNSGWYTMPDNKEAFPYGLKGCKAVSANEYFNSRLVLFLGEKDDANETRGDLRHSPEVDKQGPGRLERGKYFYAQSKAIASKLDTDFRWKQVIIPGIGHDYKKMGQAAADYLYKDQQ